MGRPTVPLISRRAVAESALKVLDEEGIDALTVRRLAKELGVTGASLYHHYKDKTEILEDVTRLVLKDTELPRSDDLEWREWLLHSNVAYVRALMNHPNIVPVVLSNRPQQSRQIIIDYLSHVLQREGVLPPDVPAISRLVESFLLGVVLVETSGIPHGDERTDPAELEDIFRDFVDMVVERAKTKGESTRKDRSARRGVRSAAG